MNKLFLPDGPILGFFSDCIDVVVASFLFSLGAVFVVTLGPSYTALYYSLSKVIVRREGKIHKEFIKAYKANFKQAILPGIVFLLLAFLVGISLYYDIRLNMGAAGIVFGAVFVIILVLLLLFMAVCFILLSRFECTIPMMVQSAFAIILQNAFVSFEILVMEILMFAGFYGTVALTPALLLFVPGMLALGQVKLMEPVMRKYIPEGSERGSRTGWDEE